MRDEEIFAAGILGSRSFGRKSCGYAGFGTHIGNVYGMNEGISLFERDIKIAFMIDGIRDVFAGNGFPGNGQGFEGYVVLMQYCIGLFMADASAHLDDVLSDREGQIVEA